jgi:antitoxin (DNA-binding transcriptional repressor) of toxin-antitoxin stability system
MAVLHISEADLARDLPAVLEKVRQGEEVVVERDSQPVAIIQPPEFRGRPIDECIALAKAHGSHATLDEGFAADLEEIITPHRRKLSEIMAALPKDSTATADADFGRDVQAFIDSHREPLDPPDWE